jgi:hypothetical protein
VRALTQVDQNRRIRGARVDLAVERLERLVLDGIDMLAHEVADTLEEGGDALRRFEFHAPQPTAGRPQPPC